MKLQIIYQHEALQMPQALEQKALRSALKQGSYGLAKISMGYFLWSIILCSLIMYWQIIGSCYCTFPMTKTICTCLSLQSVFLYQLQPHSQAKYTTSGTWWSNVMGKVWNWRSNTLVSQLMRTTSGTWWSNVMGKVWNWRSNTLVSQLMRGLQVTAVALYWVLLQIRQTFFRQILEKCQFAKLFHYQTFPLFGIRHITWKF